MGFIRAVRAGVAVVLMMSATVVQPRSSHAAPSAEETAVSCHALASNIGIPRSSIDANAVQQAVDEATAGATVKVAGACAGVQNRAGAFQTVYIDKAITLEGGYAPSNWTTSDPITNPTLLDALTNGRVIYATTAVTISNLTARNGNAPTGSGGGAYAFGSLTLNNAQFIGNSAQNNGGGAVALGEATLNGGLFQNNTSANGDGGGFYANSTLSLTGTHFLGNSAHDAGGGIYAVGAASLSSSLFQNNISAAGNGGGLVALNTLGLAGTQFSGNTASINGGGAYAGGATTLTGGTFDGNHSNNGNGGGLFASSTVVASGAQFLNNSAKTNGGGIYAGGAITLNGGRIQNNASISGQGGGLWTFSTLAMENTQFIANSAQTSGGGAVVLNAVTLNGGFFQNNSSASGDGGGLYASSTLVMAGTQFHSNSAQVAGGGAFVVGTASLNGGVFQNNAGKSGNGGGLLALSTLDLTGTQFFDNSAQGSGGGAFVAGAATFNSAIFQNNASVSGSGGGLFASSGVALAGGQFIGNRAQSGGGLYLSQSASPSRIVNSLFARNQALTSAGSAMFLMESTGAGGAVDVTFTTIASPTTSSDSAVVVGAGSANISNTLIANHNVGIYQSDTAVVRENFNLFAGVATRKIGSVDSGDNSFSGSAGFVDPANDNYRLMPISSAVNKGMDIGITIDLDGNPRPIGGGVDIGAYELANPLRERAFLPVIAR